MVRNNLYAVCGKKAPMVLMAGHKIQKLYCLWGVGFMGGGRGVDVGVLAVGLLGGY